MIIIIILLYSGIRGEYSEKFLARCDGYPRQRVLLSRRRSVRAVCCVLVNFYDLKWVKITRTSICLIWDQTLANFEV